MFGPEARDVVGEGDGEAVVGRAHVADANVEGYLGRREALLARRDIFARSTRAAVPNSGGPESPASAAATRSSCLYGDGGRSVLNKEEVLGPGDGDGAAQGRCLVRLVHKLWRALGDFVFWPVSQRSRGSLFGNTAALELDFP